MVTINRYDLTNDGWGDKVEQKATSHATPDGHGIACGSAVEAFVRTPQNQFLKLEFAGNALPGWQTYRFRDTQHPDVRFHAATGVMSVAVGQYVFSQDSDGEWKPMKVGGIVIGLHGNEPMQEAHKVANFAYSDTATARHYNTSTLKWAIKVGGKFESLDPNRIVRYNDEDKEHKIVLNTSEKLIQELFAQAKALNGIATPKKLHNLVDTWKATHSQRNPRIKQLTNPILWNGILGALAKLAGLTPAEFPG